MESLQWDLERLFCPPLDSTLIAAIVNENQDFDACFDILSELATKANLDLDAEGEENELSSNSSSIFRSSSGETGDGSITSLECSIDSLSIGDELDYATNQQDEHRLARFLKTCFPTLPEVKVDSLLKENNNNAEMVLDVILNEMYLETEQQEEVSTSPPTSVRHSNYDEDNSFKRRKKKRRQKKQIIFQNNGHRPNSNISSSPNSPATLGPTFSSSLSSPKNPWNKPDDEYQDEMIDNKLSQLATLFPNHDFENLRQALITCKGEVQIAIEELLSPNIGGVWNGTRRQTATQGEGIHQTSYTPFLSNGVVQTGHNKKRNGNTVGYKNHNDISSSSRISNSNKSHDSDELDYDDSYDPIYCRREALKYFKKRNEAFEKANASYRKRDGIASYYSDEGWKFDAEMKKWNLRAARSLVKKHSDKKRHILDLHGCSVNESLVIVEEWLDDWYSERTGSAPLKIITGKGNHSPNGVAKLPNAINKFLIKDNWVITEYKGYVLVNRRG